MVERNIEEKIVAKIKKLLPSVDCRGIWETAVAGGVKGLEGAKKRAGVAVSVASRAFDGMGPCEAALDVSISLVVRSDASPTGALLVDSAAALLDMVTAWQIDDDDAVAYFDADDFKAGGVQLSTGAAPTFANGCWSFDVNFQIRGTIKHTNH